MKLKEQLQNWSVRSRCRRLKSEPFQFPASMQGSQKIMITLPNGIQTNSMLLRMVSELPVVFPSSDLLIVIPSGSSEVARKTGIHALCPELYSANWYGLPKKGFYAQVAEFKATVLIDFETHRNIFNALVSLYSGASLRIGLAGVWGLPVYNFEVKSTIHTDELKVYRSMLDMLISIQARSIAPNFGEMN